MALRFTLIQLEYFIAVGEEGSIAQASERVNVSPPSISTAISQMEEEFGLQLKRIKIGARVVPHARTITFQIAEVAVKGPRIRAILTAIHRLRAPPSCT